MPRKLAVLIRDEERHFWELATARAVRRFDARKPPVLVQEDCDCLADLTRVLVGELRAESRRSGEIRARFEPLASRLERSRGRLAPALSDCPECDGTSERLVPEVPQLRRWAIDCPKPRSLADWLARSWHDDLVPPVDALVVPPGWWLSPPAAGSLGQLSAPLADHRAAWGQEVRNLVERQLGLFVVLARFSPVEVSHGG